MTDKTHRSAITGKFVTADHAAVNPDTTVSESRTRRPAGDYSDLRARAEACPPEDDVNSIWYSEDRLAFAIGTRDRPFVAACSPTVVLGLLDELDRLGGVVHTQGVAIDGYREEVERLRAEPIVRTVGDLTARHRLARPRIRVAGRVGTLKLVKPSDAYPGTLALIWGDWWEDVASEEPCEVLP